MTGEKSRLSDVAYEAIKEDILSNYTPGLPLSQREIAGKLGISKTPVREALHELDQSGLVEFIPGKGYFVARFSWKDVKDMFDVREALECKGVFLAATQMQAEDLSNLQALFAAVERAEDGEEKLALMEDVNKALHATIVRSARNLRLSSILAMMRDQLDCIARMTVRISGRLEKSHEEHVEILTALEKKDPALAENAMRAHLESTKESVLRSLQ